MKYYEMHEVVYQSIKDKGLLSWDKSNSFEEMWLHETNLYLQKNLLHLGKSFQGLEVLDLGTGTGTSALFSAKEGANVVGVEFSKTAIEIAHKNAQKLNLEVDFIQCDILNLNLARKFDVVIDSTVLHCIVGKADRLKFYETAKNHLKKDGFLFINTMVAIGDMNSLFPHEYFHFEGDILWSLGISDITERKTINEKSYFPHRTLLSEDAQYREFTEYGFEVVNMEITPNAEVKCMVGILKLKS